MAEKPSNPFASPEIEDLSTAEAETVASTGAAHWIGLSTLSGALLFAGYFVGCIGLSLVGYTYLVTPVNFFGAIQAVTTLIVVCCLIGGTYGALIGTALGLNLGWLSYVRRDRKPSSLLIFLGIPASLLLTFIPLIVLASVLDPPPAEEVLTFSAWVIPVASLMAGTHLVFNMDRFLVKPYARQKLVHA